MIAEVLVDVKAQEVDRTFDYKVPSKLVDVIEIGQRVKVPFGSRFIMGYVLGIKDKSVFPKLKYIHSIMDLIPSLTPELIAVAKTISITNTSPLVSILQAMLPRALKSTYQKVLRCNDTSVLPLNVALLFNRFGETTMNDNVIPFLAPIKQQIKEGNIDIIYHIKQQGKEH